MTHTQACLAVARDMGVPAVDLFTLLGGNDADVGARAPNLNDGLHLSGRCVFVCLDTFNHLSHTSHTPTIRPHKITSYYH